MQEIPEPTKSVPATSNLINYGVSALSSLLALPGAASILKRTLELEPNSMESVVVHGILIGGMLLLTAVLAVCVTWRDVSLRKAYYAALKQQPTTPPTSPTPGVSA